MAHARSDCTRDPPRASGGPAEMGLAGNERGDDEWPSEIHKLYYACVGLAFQYSIDLLGAVSTNSPSDFFN